MSMGSDFSAGYGLGLREMEANRPQAVNPYQYLSGLRRSAGGGGRGATPTTSRMSPAEIANRAAELANQRERERLENQSLELNNQAQRIAMARERQDRSLGMAERAEARERGGYLEALERGEYYRGAADERDQRMAASHHAELFEDAVRGAYTGDGRLVKRYFDELGQSNVSIDNYSMNKDGKVSVSMGGKKAEFENPRQFIMQMLAPAQAVMQQQEAPQGLQGDMQSVQKQIYDEYLRTHGDPAGGVRRDAPQFEEFMNQRLGHMGYMQGAPGSPNPELGGDAGGARVVYKKGTSDIAFYDVGGKFITPDEYAAFENQRGRSPETVGLQESTDRGRGSITRREGGKEVQTRYEDGQPVKYIKDDKGKWVKESEYRERETSDEETATDRSLQGESYEGGSEHRKDGMYMSPSSIM